MQNWACIYLKWDAYGDMHSRKIIYHSTENHPNYTQSSQSSSWVHKRKPWIIFRDPWTICTPALLPCILIFSTVLWKISLLLLQICVCTHFQSFGLEVKNLETPNTHTTQVSAPHSSLVWYNKHTECKLTTLNLFYFFYFGRAGDRGKANATLLNHYS